VKYCYINTISLQYNTVYLEIYAKKAKFKILHLNGV